MARASRACSHRGCSRRLMVHGALYLGRAAVERQGRGMVETGFALLDPQLGRHPFAVGDAFTIANAALFYVERWAPQRGIGLPVNVQRHFARLCERPAVRRIR